jgi:hypothetical protein
MLTIKKLIAVSILKEAPSFFPAVSSYTSSTCLTAKPCGWGGQVVDQQK